MVFFWRHPIHVPRYDELIAKLLSPARVELPASRPISISCLDLLTRLLERDPAERLPLKQFCDHDFLMGVELIARPPPAALVTDTGPAACAPQRLAALTNAQLHRERKAAGLKAVPVTRTTRPALIQQMLKGASGGRAARANPNHDASKARLRAAAQDLPGRAASTGARAGPQAPAATTAIAAPKKIKSCGRAASAGMAASLTGSLIAQLPSYPRARAAPLATESRAVINAAFLAESVGQDLKAYAFYIRGLEMVVAAIGAAGGDEQAELKQSIATSQHVWLRQAEAIKQRQVKMDATQMTVRHDVLAGLAGALGPVAVARLAAAYGLVGEAEEAELGSDLETAFTKWAS